jgi:predicted nucleic acid-binding Zn ribbon protein
MPFYFYNCKKCDKTFKAFHSIKEKYLFCEEIESCEERGELNRIPSNFSHVKSGEANKGKPVGSLVNEFIEENKKSVQEQKEEYKKEYSK